MHNWRHLLHAAPLLITALLPASTLLLAAPARPEPVPVISVIIDDLGEQLQATRRAIRLPGRIDCSFLPDGRLVTQLAEQAHARGKEVMLHLPMEARETRRLGRVALTHDMDDAGIRATLRRALSLVPHARGINNHMGSLVTEDPAMMASLMHELRLHEGLFFIDSRTSPHSIAAASARQLGIANGERDIFLDNDRDITAIARQFEKLLRQARRNGSAIAIGHPYPETLAYLEYTLPRLQRRQVELVPVSELLSRNAAHDERHSPLILTAHPSLPKTVSTHKALD